MKQLLMVAYHYPPDGSSSGVLRSLKFSKYLPGNGWIPHVLTLSDSFYPEKDDGLLEDIPAEAVVHRTFALDTGRHLAIRGRYLGLLAIPDRFVSWLPFGVGKGLRVIRNAGISALYSTSPPPTAHLIAAGIKTIIGIPWIADFRDPWVEEGIHPPPDTVRYEIESALERFVVRRADRVVVTTPYLRRDFLSRYPEMRPEKIRVIYNGYDEADFGTLTHVERQENFEIMHAGFVTPDFRDPFPLLKSVATLIKEGILQRDKVKITFLGGGTYLLSERFTTGVKELGLNGVVKITSRVPHREALQRMEHAGVLLLLQASNDTRSLIPAKTFEYLRLNRPILALILEGATADLMKEMEHCHVVDPSDQPRLQNAVMLLYSQWKQSFTGVQVSRPIWKYKRSSLTAELARLLEELVAT